MIKPQIVKSWRDFPRGAWSHSSLNQISNICSMQYKFKKILRVPAERKSPNLVFGIVMDEVVFKPFYRAMKMGDRATRDELVAAFRDRWTKELSNPLLDFPDEKKPPSWWVEKGEEVIAVVVRDAPQVKVRDFDIKFVVPLLFSDGKEASQRPLTGSLDMLTINGGRLLIVDFKTAGKSPNQKSLNEDLQRVSYVYALEQVMPELLGKVDFMWQYYLLTKEVTYKSFDTKVTTRDKDSFMRLIELADKMVTAECAMPQRNYNFFCDGCEYRKACNNLLGKPEDA